MSTSHSLYGILLVHRLIRIVMCPEILSEMCITSNIKKHPQHLCKELDKVAQCPSRANRRVVTLSITAQLPLSFLAQAAAVLEPVSHCRWSCSSWETPQTGNSQPFRHTRLTLRPTIKVRKEKRRQEEKKGVDGRLKQGDREEKRTEIKVASEKKKEGMHGGVR